jgi:hypothetical protein
MSTRETRPIDAYAACQRYMTIATGFCLALACWQAAGCYSIASQSTTRSRVEDLRGANLSLELLGRSESSLRLVATVTADPSAGGTEREVLYRLDETRTEVNAGTAGLLAGLAAVYIVHSQTDDEVDLSIVAQDGLLIGPLAALVSWGVTRGLMDQGLVRKSYTSRRTTPASTPISGSSAAPIAGVDVTFSSRMPSFTHSAETGANGKATLYLRDVVTAVRQTGRIVNAPLLTFQVAMGDTKDILSRRRDGSSEERAQLVALKKLAAPSVEPPSAIATKPDILPPTVVIISPASTGTTASTSSIGLRGTISRTDDRTASVTVRANGETVPDVSYDWALSGGPIPFGVRVPLQRGTNVIAVTATAGDKTSQTVTRRVTYTAPTPATDRSRPSPPAIQTPRRTFADLSVVGTQFVEPSDNNVLDADESAQIAFTIRNRGRGEAENVEITVTSVSDASDLTYRKSISLGTIAAGKDRAVTIPVSAGSDVRDDQVTFRVVVQEEWGFEPEPFTVTFDTRALVPPQLVIDDENIGIDDDSVGLSYGNNNGRIETKEAVEVTFILQNAGAGIAEGVRTRVTVKGEPGTIYNISDLDFSLGDLDPGDFRRVTFAFQTNARYSAPDVQVTVAVAESTGRFGVDKALAFALDTPLKPSRDVVFDPLPASSPGLKPPTLPRLTSPADDVPENAETQFQDAVAVIFGIEDYKHTPPARYANRDATVFYEYAKGVLGIAERNILLATNEGATKGEFDKAFAEDGWIYRHVRPGRTEVFLFYSGHGAASQSRSAYLIPYDIDPNYAAGSGVSIEDVYSRLASLDAKHVTVFLDACFSGSSRMVPGEEQQMLIADARPISVSIEGATTYPNMTLMAASSQLQVSSADREQQHGVFTFFLLQGLQGHADRDGDQRVTAAELADYLESNVPDRALLITEREQTPSLTLSDPDRVLVRYR